MGYKFSNKVGETPPSLQGVMTYSEMIGKVNGFLNWQDDLPKLETDTDKINYYNKHSFYNVEEIA